MEKENKNAMEHENIRRAIEVGSYAIKNLRQAGEDKDDILKPLRDVVIKATGKLDTLISN